MELVHRRFQAFRSLLGELGDADIADVAVLDMRAHRLNPDQVADDGKLLDVLLGAASDLELNGRIDGAAHLLDRLIERQPLGRLIVDRGDDVAGHDPGLGGRRVVDRRHDLDEPIFLGDLDSKSAEFALRLNLHVLERLGVHVARMGVERREHAVDGGLDQLGLVGLFDVVAADLVEHVAEEIELAIGVGRRRIGRRTHVGQRLRRSDGDRRAQNDA